MLLDHVHEGLEQPYCNLISTLIIVTVTWEIALGLEAERETGLITDGTLILILVTLSLASSLAMRSRNRSMVFELTINLFCLLILVIVNFIFLLIC